MAGRPGNRGGPTASTGKEKPMLRLTYQLDMAAVAPLWTVTEVEVFNRIFADRTVSWTFLRKVKEGATVHDAMHAEVDRVLSSCLEGVYCSTRQPYDHDGKVIHRGWTFTVAEAKATASGIELSGRLHSAGPATFMMRDLEADWLTDMSVD